MNNIFLRGLTRNLIIVGFVSLFTDLSSQMVFPLIPLYLITVLSAPAWVVGVVEGAAESTASLLKVFSGFWSDKIKRRKPFVLFGYSLSTITKPLFAFATIWPLVLFIRVIERVGKGIRNAPRDAIIAESADPKMLGRAYSFHRAMDGIGSITGAVLAFFLLPSLGFKNIFLIAIIPGVIAVIFVLLLKEKKDNNVLQKKKINLKIGLRSLPMNLRLFIVVSTVFAAGHFGYAFLLLKARDIGLGNNYTILLYVLFYVVYTVFIIPAGILSDRIGRKPVLLIGYILFAIVSFILIFTDVELLLLSVFLLYGIFYSLIDGVQRAFVADLAPKDLKATAIGTFHTCIGLVALPGGFIAGVIWDTISPMATFIYGLILTILAVFLFSFVKNNKKS